MQIQYMKVSVIIPTRNEAENLPEVLQEVLKYADEVIVVDGNSKDRTQEVARSFGVKVVQDNGLGKGDALRVGANAASGEILVFIDADQSHDPRDIPFLVRPIKNGHADHVHGSRMLGGSEELFSTIGEIIRLFGSCTITTLVNFRFRTRLTDTQNGFRALKRSVFHELNLKQNITTIEQEMVVETLRRGFRLLEIPTHEYRRNFGSSTISIWRVGFTYVATLLRQLLKPQIREVPQDLAKIQALYSTKWTRTLVDRPQLNVIKNNEL
jgi:glycosyltransferase involved in cell wall biosynthesis